MAYQLAIDTPGGMPHPSFEYASLKDALSAAELAIDTGHLAIQDGLTVFTGSGTIYKVISDEHIKQGARPEEKPFCMVVCVTGGQLPPFWFDSEAEMDGALDKAIASGGGYQGVLRHTAKTGHEYNFVVLHPGAVVMRMTREQYVQNQQRLIEEASRKAKQVQGSASFPSPSPILIPGKN